MFSDGCTALAWTTPDSQTTFLAQNWDWQTEQKPNLIRLRIKQPSKPSIDMITEAGMIGKIGLNSSGVGVCLNAIRAKGVNWEKLPVHLALRACLDCESKDQAVKRLTDAGVASACHILVADEGGSVGLECSHQDIVRLPMSAKGSLTHTNHFVDTHPGVDDLLQLKDSPDRLGRINSLVQSCQPNAEQISKILEDQDGFPTSICREQTEESTVATLFSIVMDLGKRRATVRLGKPCRPSEFVELAPNDVKEFRLDKRIAFI